MIPDCATSVHWGHYKMATILQMTFSNSFFYWNMLCYDFDLIKFVRKNPSNNINNINIDTHNGFVPSSQQIITWNNDGLFTDAYMHSSNSISWPLCTYMINRFQSLQSMLGFIIIISYSGYYDYASFTFLYRYVWKCVYSVVFPDLICQIDLKLEYKMVWGRNLVLDLDQPHNMVF